MTQPVVEKSPLARNRVAGRTNTGVGAQETYPPGTADDVSRGRAAGGRQPHPATVAAGMAADEGKLPKL